jgi:ABC-2 type transport system ATP-binding protein
MGKMSISSGEIRIKGKSITKQFEEAVVVIEGIVENSDFYPFLSDYHNLLHFARISRKLSQTEINEKITELAKLVKLENRIDTK